MKRTPKRAPQPTGILYWNIRNSPSCLLALRALVVQYAPQIIMLVESDFDDPIVIAVLGGNFRPQGTDHNKVKFYAATPDFSIVNTRDSKHFAVGRLGVKRKSILLVGVHLPSKMYGKSPNSQARHAELYRLGIEKQEKLLGIRRTVIFGDFNMNAYEWGMTDRSRGFRTVPSRQLAQQSMTQRSDSSLPQRCFYNPMWALLGDFTPGQQDVTPAGTHFWSPKNPEDTHWNSLDAVLISPQAIPLFDVASLQIISATIAPSHVFFHGTVSPGYSDHLPLFFQLVI